MTPCLSATAFGFAIGLCFAPLGLTAADWPQWRGLHRDGISAETGLLGDWPKEGPRLVWQVKDIGTGYSTPAVVGDRLYLLSNQGLDDEFVQALDAKDGKKVWSQRIGKVGNPKQQPNYPAARSTPTVDGDWLFAFGSDGDLACLDRATGHIRWQKNVRREYDGQPGVWAYAESPLVDGDAVVCTPGGSNATMIAVNKQTGELIWKCVVPDGEQAAYTSALVDETGGVRQYVQMLQKGLVGVEAKSGKLLWRYDRTAKGCPAVIPTPVAGGDFIYSAGARVGGGGVRLKAEGGRFEAEQAYFSPKLPTSVGGALKVDQYLYGTSAGALLCLEFTTGNTRWDERSIAPASLCYADKRLYLHGEDGEVALVEATPEAYREKGRFKPVDPPDRGASKAWAYPVIANGRLYIRDMGTLWCYNIKAGG